MIIFPEDILLFAKMLWFLKVVILDRYSFENPVFINTPVKNDNICSWRLRVPEWYGEQEMGIYRVIKQKIFDLSEGILRNIVFNV